MRSYLSEFKRDLVARFSAIKRCIVLAVIQCRYTVELRGSYIIIDYDLLRCIDGDTNMTYSITEIEQL